MALAGRRRPPASSRTGVLSDAVLTRRLSPVSPRRGSKPLPRKRSAGDWKASHAPRTASHPTNGRTDGDRRATPGAALVWSAYVVVSLFLPRLTFSVSSSPRRAALQEFDPPLRMREDHREVPKCEDAGKPERCTTIGQKLQQSAMG
jgi:hypothetical protein